MNMSQEEALRIINQNILYLVRMLQQQVMADVHTGRLHIRTDQGLVDLEENKEIIEGTPEVKGRVYDVIHKTNQHLEEYIAEYGSLVPPDALY